jgi:hypothetical protein
MIRSQAKKSQPSQKRGENLRSISLSFASGLDGLNWLLTRAQLHRFHPTWPLVGQLLL